MTTLLYPPKCCQEVVEDAASREYAEANRDAFNADELRARPKKEPVALEDTDALFAVDATMVEDVAAMGEAGFQLDEGTGVLDDDSEPSADDMADNLDDLISNDDLGGLLGSSDD